MAKKDRSGSLLETARQVVSEVVDTAARVVGQAGETAAGLANSAMDTAAGAVASVSPTAGELVRPEPSTKRAVEDAARRNTRRARTQAEGVALTDAAVDAGRAVADAVPSPPRVPTPAEALDSASRARKSAGKAAR